MMKGTIRIHLPGMPVGKGRPRFSMRGGIPRAYTDEKTSSYEGMVRMAGAIAMEGSEPLEGPLALSMVATFPIPASWSKRKKEEAAMGMIRPTGKPDADNILKCLADGLNGIVYKDDAQIVRALVIKSYGMKPNLFVAIRPINSNEDQTEIAESL